MDSSRSDLSDLISSSFSPSRSRVACPAACCASESAGAPASATTSAHDFLRLSSSASAGGGGVGATSAAGASTTAASGLSAILCGTSSAPAPIVLRLPCLVCRLDSAALALLAAGFFLEALTPLSASWILDCRSSIVSSSSSSAWSAPFISASLS